MLKKSITFFALLMVALIVSFGFIQLLEDPNADVSPLIGNGNVADTTPPAGFPYPTQFNFNYSAVGGMNAGTVGAMYLNGYYYFNRWNSTMMYRYLPNGPGGGPGTKFDSLTYVGSCRDLTTDGTYLYAGPASTVLYRLDPTTGATLKTFTLAGGASRGMAWDPNRKGFWNTNFGGNIFFHDTNGVLQKTITSTLLGKYGLGFDSTSTPGTAFLWAWDQTSTSTAGAYKFNILTGALANTYIFTLPGVSIGSAGGAEVLAKDGKLLLLCNYQNVAMCGYKLADIAPPVPTGSWSEQTSGLTTALYSVSAVTNAVAWVGGAGSKVLRTTNAGQNWVNAAGDLPTAQDVYCVWGIDVNNCIITTSPAAGTYIYKTTNGGTNWTQTLFQATGFMDGFYFLNATTGFAYGDPVGTRWSLFKTTNAGTTWDSTGLYIPAGGLAGWNNAMFGIGTKIWFGTNGTPLWYSANSGSTWTSQTTPAINQYAIWFNNDNVGLCGGANLNVTTNGGVNWTALTSIGTGNVSGITGAATSWWFTRQATAVNYSSNNGTSWTAQYTAPAGSFYHLTLSRSGATIWGVRANGGISRYGQTTGITPVNSEVPSAYNLSQNYPNPFNPVTKISYSLPENGFVKLTVYDALGRTVSNLVNENKVAGIYSVDFNAVSLPSGVYFYRLEVNGFSETMKMLIIK